MMDRDDLLLALARIETKLDSLDHCLSGNGQPGFIEKTTTRLNELEGDTAKAKGALGLIGVVLTTIGGALASHLWRGAN